MSGHISEKLWSYLEAGTFQNHLNAFECFDVECVKNIFGRKHLHLQPFMPQLLESLNFFYITSMRSI